MILPQILHHMDDQAHFFNFAQRDFHMMLFGILVLDILNLKLSEICINHNDKCKWI